MSANEPQPGVCYRHPDKETALRCGRCDRPICPACARKSQVGYRCPDCVYQLQSRYFTRGTYVDPLSAPPTRPVLTYTLLVMLIVVWGLQELRGGSTDSETLVQLGSTAGARILQGEVWRLFLAMFLHIGLVHLLFNGFALINIGRDVESRYGYGRFLVIYFAAGFFGNLVSFAWRGPAEFSAGASGAIFGLIGAELGFVLFHRRQLGALGQEHQRRILILIGINLALGATIFLVNNLAHLGGLLAGLGLGYVLAPRYLPAVDAAGHNDYEDQATLRKLWWVPALTVGLLLVGTWGLIYGWQNYGDQITRYTARFRLPLMVQVLALFSGVDPTGLLDQAEPELVTLDDQTECIRYLVEQADETFICSGFIEVIRGVDRRTINLKPLSDADRFHLSLGVYAEGDDLIVRAANEAGETTQLRISAAIGSGAEQYIGVVPAAFTIEFEAVDGRADQVGYQLTVKPAAAP